MGHDTRIAGHRVVLLPPHHVRPYVRGNKTDRTDAKGILEASRNEEIHPVPVKTVAQQVLTSLHRLRSGWVAERTARLNALRGLLRELGFFIPMGAEKVVPALYALIEDAESELPDPLRNILYEGCQEIRDIEARIKQAEAQLEATARQIPAVALLRTVPGVGPLTSTALVAFLGNSQRFPSGRHLASYLGLTPREFSSGLKRRLGRISKRGDGYLRTLLIQGARSVRFTPGRPSPTACASAPTSSGKPSSTTRPPSPSPTRWPASSGPSGPVRPPTAPSTRLPEAPTPLTRELLS